MANLVVRSNRQSLQLCCQETAGWMPKGQPRNQFPALQYRRLAGTTCRSQLPGPTLLHQTSKAEGACSCWEGITVRYCTRSRIKTTRLEYGLEI